jgi:DNA-binding PadR family transcriptional regulator
MSDDVKRALPLKPVWFHILLTLAEGPAHGYAIRKAVEARTEGAVKLWPTTLYGALSDLVDRGYIAEAGGGEEPTDNLGRIDYVLTLSGDRVLEAEVNRLDQLVRAARAARSTRPTPA